ncbi:MAG: NAD(P)-dependent oxidoreductase [Rhizobiaceae bacterium]
MNQPRVGIIGLGIMGMAYAKNLLKAEIEVCGYDIAIERCHELENHGGIVLDSIAAMGQACDVVLVALASVKAQTNSIEALSKVLGPDHVVCEMGTFSLQQKMETQSILAPCRSKVLDCPVSGTGAQAAKGDLSVYVSGDKSAAEIVAPVFQALARDIRYVGEFGTGTKLKFVANLLVTIHNLAAAESLQLAKSSGLDLSMVYDAICAGAGTSRMFEVRGPMMVADHYEPATMTMEVYMKDLQLILDHARDVNCATPLMSASLPFYIAGLAQERGHEDTAALYGILDQLSKPATST